ncbi:hypothetical protein OG272_14885 [Streptomyces sp. NBC_00104]|uniref:hypothetical protein n=1 Tax=unclassified Streptomyces TaxID=2593676 RepID=UPI003244AE31
MSTESRYDHQHQPDHRGYHRHHDPPERPRQAATATRLHVRMVAKVRLLNRDLGDPPS